MYEKLLNANYLNILKNIQNQDFYSNTSLWLSHNGCLPKKEAVYLFFNLNYQSEFTNIKNIILNNTNKIVCCTTNNIKILIENDIIPDICFVTFPNCYDRNFRDFINLPESFIKLLVEHKTLFYISLSSHTNYFDYIKKKKLYYKFFSKSNEFIDALKISKIKYKNEKINHFLINNQYLDKYYYHNFSIFEVLHHLGYYNLFILGILDNNDKNNLQIETEQNFYFLLQKYYGMNLKFHDKNLNKFNEKIKVNIQKKGNINDLSNVNNLFINYDLSETNLTNNKFINEKVFNEPIFKEYVSTKTFSCQEEYENEINNINVKYENEIYTYSDKNCISNIALYLKNKISNKTLQGMCHGCGIYANEVLWFKEFLPENSVIHGTEISKNLNSNSLNDKNMHKHDFHLIKNEWINKFDFIYSNSLNFSHSLKTCIKTWMKCLKSNGLLLIEFNNFYYDKNLKSTISYLPEHGFEKLMKDYSFKTLLTYGEKSTILNNIDDTKNKIFNNPRKIYVFIKK